MATKYYGINDKWTDDDIENVIEIASEDGTVDSVKVNGEEYGGGGASDLGTVAVTFVDSSNYGNSYVISIIWASDEEPAQLYSVLESGDFDPDYPYNVVLYKGTCYLSPAVFDDNVHKTATYSATGDIEISDDGTAVIHGPGTITVTSIA